MKTRKTKSEEVIQTSSKANPSPDIQTKLEIPFVYSRFYSSSFLISHHNYKPISRIYGLDSGNSEK